MPFTITGFAPELVDMAQEWMAQDKQASHEPECDRCQEIWQCDERPADTNDGKYSQRKPWSYILHFVEVRVELGTLSLEHGILKE